MLRVIPVVGFIFSSLLLKAQHLALETDSLDHDVHVIAIESLSSLPLVYIRKGEKLYGLSKVEQSANPVLENRKLGIEINLPAHLNPSYPHVIRTLRIKEWLEEEVLSLKKLISSFILVQPVYFDFNSDIIRNDASAELDRLVEIMTSCPTLNVTVVARTDQKGTTLHNKLLAKKRGKSVERYLKNNGIAVQRIVINTDEADIMAKKGWEGTISEEKRDQMNRRAEFFFNSELP